MPMWRFRVNDSIHSASPHDLRQVSLGGYGEDRTRTFCPDLVVFIELEIYCSLYKPMVVWMKRLDFTIISTGLLMVCHASATGFAWRRLQILPVYLSHWRATHRQC